LETWLLINKIGNLAIMITAWLAYDENRVQCCDISHFAWNSWSWKV